MSQRELLQNLDELDALLQKSQIVRGGNSDPKKWAGSSSKEESVPHNVQNGTDYKPSRDIAHKALAELSIEEIEHYLRMRKSGRPNLQAALYEIRQLDGVTDSVCTSCGGYGENSVTKSVCRECGGFGVVIDCATVEAAEMAKAIADKYNVGPNSSKEDMDKCAVADRGRMDKKGSNDFDDDDDDSDDQDDSDRQNLSEDDDNDWDSRKSNRRGGRKAAFGRFNKGSGGDEDDDDEQYGNYRQKARDDEDEDYGSYQRKAYDDDNNDTGYQRNQRFGSKDDDDDDKDLSGVEKSLLVLEEGMAVMLKGLKYLLEHTQSGSDVQKSLHAADVPRPAGPPRSIGTNIRVLERGNGIDPTDINNLTMEDIKKSVAQMALDGLVDPLEVVRLESNVAPDPELMAQVAEYVRKNGVPRQAMPSRARA